MNRTVLAAVAAAASFTAGADWPQWRGPGRDGKAAGFKPPAVWLQELTRRWLAEVGGGTATPALAGDRLSVFSRQGGKEIIHCLDAANGKPVWHAEDHPVGGSAGWSSACGASCPVTTSTARYTNAARTRT